MTDLRHTITPKSDQLNADDLIGRVLTVTVTKVALSGAPDQPVSIHFEGDNGKPYKPCLSMRRVMIKVWGEDGNAFVGRRMTLYRDDRVRFGPDAVGGIRISHMSDLDREMTMALTDKRGSRKPYIVKPLRPEQSNQRQDRPPTQQRRDHDDAGGFPGDQPRDSFDVLAWAATFEASLPDYTAIDPMRDDWTAHKAELQAADAERFKVVNRAVVDRAAEIGKAVGGNTENDNV